MENNQESKIIKFSELKEEIMAELNKRGSKIGIAEPVTLVDGFVNQSINMELSGGLVIGGPTIPMIMLVGNDSGRIYYFALKALLPRIY